MNNIENFYTLLFFILAGIGGYSLLSSGFLGLTPLVNPRIAGAIVFVIVLIAMVLYFKDHVNVNVH